MLIADSVEAHGASLRLMLPAGTSARSHRIRERQVPIPLSESFPYAYKSNNTGKETDTPWVDTAPQGMQTLPPVADY